MDFREFLEQHASKIDKRLDKVLGEQALGIEKVSSNLKDKFDKFIESGKEGKRIRGALVLLGYKIGGGQEMEKVLDGAVAWEIFQTAILAQDDVIDKSTLRRGRDSLYQSLGGDNRAVSLAICLSDIGFFTAYRLLTNLEVEASLKIAAVNFYSQTLTQTVLGEMLDIEGPFLKRDFEDEDALKIGLLKTARYTISGPLMLGAMLGGAKLATLQELQVFGDNLGIGFQIQDDILGVFGDENRIGKSVTSDVKECKTTLLISYAQKKGTIAQKKILEKNYGNLKVSQKGIEEVSRVFRETGALKYAHDQVDKYFAKAEEALKGVEEPLLYSLVDFLRERDK